MGPDRPGSKPPWWCPICHQDLASDPEQRSWSCPDGHSFDVARQGYLNLLRAGRGGRGAGDSREMVQARRRILDGGAFDLLSESLSVTTAQVLSVVPARNRPSTVLDVGCGEGHYLRRVAARLSADAGGPQIVWSGLDIAKPAVAAAAARHREGHYAVASAFELPVPPHCVDLVLNVFGPLAVEELARIVRPGGRVLAAHPGPRHLASLRSVVYEESRPHEMKDPFRGAPAFGLIQRDQVTYPLVLEPAEAVDLFDMTPYRWHGKRDTRSRLAAGVLETTVDIVVSLYQREDASPEQPTDRHRRTGP